MLVVDGKEYTQELRVISDPNLPVQNDLEGTSEEYEVWTGDDLDGEWAEDADEEMQEAGGIGPGPRSDG